MKDAPCESLWTVPDVMHYLQLSRSWVYEKAEAGILPSLRICGVLRFDPEAIRAFARGEVRPGASVLPLRRKGDPP